MLTVFAFDVARSRAVRSYQGLGWHQRSGLSKFARNHVPERMMTSSLREITILGLACFFAPALASEYCTTEQFDRDRAVIENAISNGTIVKGPQGLRDSILIQESTWFEMNYLQQIAFMQSFDCAMGGAGGKHLLYMDVRSLATGKIAGDLVTWHPKASRVSVIPTGAQRRSLLRDRYAHADGTVEFSDKYD